jgi:hypothetical protein
MAPKAIASGARRPAFERLASGNRGIRPNSSPELETIRGAADRSAQTRVQRTQTAPLKRADGVGGTAATLSHARICRDYAKTYLSRPMPWALAAALDQPGRARIGQSLISIPASAPTLIGL